jgi:hypothetical protein
MLVDGLEMTEGSQVKNLTVASGAAYPDAPTDGELFYNTSIPALCVYHLGEWSAVGVQLDTSEFVTLVGGKIPSDKLPSYVDDVVDIANQAALPMPGEVGKIYITLDDNKIHRWSGSAYFEINASSGTADQALKLATPRTISLLGDVTGQVEFDGSMNVSVAAKLSGDLVATKTFTGAVAVDYTKEGSYVAATVTGATNLSITGVPNDGKAYGMTFELTNAGTNVTWPASVVWLGTAPTLRASGVSMVTLVTRNGGSTWYGSAA